MKKIIFLIFFITFTTLNISQVHAEQTVVNGTYIIKSVINNDKVIDLSGANTTNSSNIQLYSANNTNAQKWIIQYQKNGYYTIASSINKNKVIDIKNNNINNNTNIQLYDFNGTDAQLWTIVHLNNSFFTIKHKNSNYCLDLVGGSTNDYTNVQLYKCNNTNAQKFKIVEQVEPKKTIDDGLYTINSALNEKKVIDLNGANTNNYTNIQLYSYNDTSAQKWYIKYLNNGYYSITSKINSKKCLDVKNGSFLSSTNIQLYDCNNTDAQKFIIKQTSDGYYQIFTKIDPIPLDVSGANTADYTNIQIYYNNGTKAQKFKFKKINEKILDNGVYTIKSKLNTNKVLDIDSANSNDNTNVQIYTSNNTNAQKWYITRLSNGYYTIRSGLNSNFYLSNSNNNVLTTTTPTEWKLDFISENEYYIVSKNNNLYLNLENSNTKDKTNINLLNYNGNNAQKFIFTLTKINENSPTFSNGYYTINSNLNNKQVVDVSGASKSNNTNIQLYSSNNTNAQIWYFNYLNNGYYSITSALNNKTVLDLANGNTASGTNIQLYKSNNTDAQQWKLQDDGNGNISIISKKSNICITPKNNSTANSTNIQANTCNNQNSQKFKLNKENSQKSKQYTGIDISQYQGNINWEKLSSTNIGFIILRLGIGDNWPSQDDKKFKEYVANCEKYNIPYGVYLYSYAKNIDGSTALYANSESATSEAAHAIRLLNDIKNLGYNPTLKTAVYFDTEEKSVSFLGKTKLTQIADKFCSIIQSNGYNCGIYASKSWLNDNLDAPELARKYNIWLAEWPKYTKTHDAAFASQPTYTKTSYKIWQFSDTGSINGINGNVDLDIAYNIFD